LMTTSGSLPMACIILKSNRAGPFSFKAGDSIRPRRCLAGKGVQLLDAGQAKLTDEPGERPARKPARIFDEVAFAGISMGLD